MKMKGRSLKNVNKDWTLFLDRDGVINVRREGEYITKPEDFVFIDGVPQAISELNKIFKYIFIVTNQQGIDKGLMTENDLSAIHKKMLDELAIANARIDDIFYCPDLEGSNSFFRKPNIGMALAARKKYPDINFKKSVMVGDSISDMVFGKRLGMVTVWVGLNTLKKNNVCSFICYNIISFVVFTNMLLSKFKKK